jgi:hypothetical protein
MTDEASKFIYLCSECRSWQFSDVPNCPKCGTPSPNCKPARDTQAETLCRELTGTSSDQWRNLKRTSNGKLKHNLDTNTETTAAADASTRANKPSTLSRRVRLIGWWQVLAAAWVLLAPITAADSLRDLSFWSRMPILIAVVGVNAVAGIQTLRRHRVGYWLSLWNHVAQIPVIACPGLTFTYFGLGGVVGYLSLQRLTVNDQILKVGIEAELEQGSRSCSVELLISISIRLESIFSPSPSSLCY